MSEQKSLLKFVIFYRYPARIFLLLMSFIAAVFGLLNPFFQKAFIDGVMNNPRLNYFGFTISANPLTNISLAFCAALCAQALSLCASLSWHP